MNGAEANGRSQFPSISANGRFVAFESEANNLVSNDFNATSDIFVVDLLTHNTEVMSVDGKGAVGSGPSHYPSISGDGRYVAFYSYAILTSNDQNHNVDIYVRDRVAGTTTLVTATFDGSPSTGYSEAYYPKISVDGRFIAYHSSATDLVPGDVNNNSDAFVYDVQRGINQIVSVTSSGEQGSGFSASASISADGRFISFSSNAANLVPEGVSHSATMFPQVLVKDRMTGAMNLGSITLDGSVGDFSAGTSSLSGDGRYVAFYSRSTHLVPNDLNWKRDVFIFDFLTHTMKRITPDGVEPNGYSYAPSFSQDGKRVAFWSKASNFADDDHNGAIDVFLYDLPTDQILRISAGPMGEGNGDSGYPTISAEGRFVAFPSLASNLVAGDQNDVSDVFVAEILP